MRKQLLCLALSLCLLVCVGFSASAETPVAAAAPAAAPAAGATSSVDMPTSAFASYTYDCWGNTIECPNPYSLIRKVDGVALGVGDLKKVIDVYAKDGFIYLTANGDTEKDNAIIKMDEQLNLVSDWRGYYKDGAYVPFSKPCGLFVTDGGLIYVTDTSTYQIYCFAVEGEGAAAKLNLQKTIDRPSTEDSSIIDEEFVQRYIPSKLVVDRTDRVYVVATNVNEGIVTFNEDGKFDGFLAAGKVTIDPFTKFMKKYVYTEAQKKRIVTFVPINYNNIDLDASGFIYSTLAASNESTVQAEIKAKKGTEQGALVRRLNMMGSDILKRDGYMPPVGDADILDTMMNKDANYQGLSQITDVSCGNYGTYAILDNKRNHIFVYNFEGFLLYAFSGPDISAGGMKTPIALTQSGEYIYALDSNSRSIFMYKQTAFASSIMKAIQLEKDGQYSAASEVWSDVLTYDATYDLAYLGLGKTAYWKGDYEEASRLFKLCNNKSWYSKAWSELRKDVLAKWFMPIVLVILGIVALVIVLKIVKKAKAKKRKEAED